MTEMTDLAAQARLVAQLAEHTDEARLDAPTPCEAYAVRHLLGHLVGLAGAFQDVARKQTGPATSGPPDAAHRPDVEPGWRSELERNLGGMVEAWRDELVLHGWDLARATGQDYAPGRDDLDTCHALLSSWAEEGRPKEGPFGPPVPVSEDAPLLDRVVALSGRRPDWAPPGA